MLQQNKFDVVRYRAVFFRCAGLSHGAGFPADPLLPGDDGKPGGVLYHLKGEDRRQIYRILVEINGDPKIKNRVGRLRALRVPALAGR